MYLYIVTVNVLLRGVSDIQEFKKIKLLIQLSPGNRSNIRKYFGGQKSRDTRFFKGQCHKISICLRILNMI